MLTVILLEWITVRNHSKSSKKFSSRILVDAHHRLYRNHSYLRFIYAQRIHALLSTHRCITVIYLSRILGSLWWTKPMIAHLGASWDSETYISYTSRFCYTWSTLLSLAVYWLLNIQPNGVYIKQFLNLIWLLSLQRIFIPNQCRVRVSNDVETNNVQSEFGIITCGWNSHHPFFF